MNSRPDNVNDLEAWGFDDYAAKKQSSASGARLGVVVGGSISRGLAVKLDAHVGIEELAIGRYIVIRGQQKRFFCMINDISLHATNPQIESDPPDISDRFLTEIYSGTIVYSIIRVTPMLVMIDETEGPLPVKTIPGHFRQAFNATEADVNQVFGDEDDTHFHVGSPLELQETQINLDLRRLVERSVGVFGKSGTGKSFLTRVLMAGVLHRGIGVSLIFDMHNDYGWEITTERGPKVKGLKQLFNDKVVILTLDEASSRRRNAKYDFAVKLGFDEIEPEDIAMLKANMDLTDPMLDATHSLKELWGKRWVTLLLKNNSHDFNDAIDKTNILRGTLSGLLRRLQRFKRWDFLIEESANDSVQRIIEYLVNQKKSVVLEFGKHGNSLDAYMLVANYLTRRIHQRYIEMVDKALGDNSVAPPQLLITIEEAHKFLEPQVASQTTFGIIAREMRKYNVTLLVVDQRPSAIDEEVMSQIGTRVTALLDNERDITAVLNGISGAGGLREVLARLETKQQAIIMGHAVPMPVVIKPRTYNEAFYQSVMVQPVDLDQAKVSLGGGQKRRL